VYKKLLEHYGPDFKIIADEMNRTFCYD